MNGKKIMMERCKVGANGRLLLPLHLRQEYGLAIGGNVIIEPYEEDGMDGVVLHSFKETEKPPYRCPISIPGVVVIPKEYRQCYQCKIGCMMEIEERAAGILIHPADSDNAAGDKLYRKLNSTGRVSIPTRLRAKYGMNIEDQVKLLATSEGMLVVRLEDAEKEHICVCTEMNPVGQVTIPLALRKKYSFTPHKAVGVVRTEKGILIMNED